MVPPDALPRWRTRLGRSLGVRSALRSLSSRAPVHIREARDEVAVTDQDHSAGQRRGRHVRQYDDARGSPSELAAYTELHGAVDQFVAREASLAWLDRG